MSAAFERIKTGLQQAVAHQQDKWEEVKSAARSDEATSAVTQSEASPQ